MGFEKNFFCYKRSCLWCFILSFNSEAEKTTRFAPIMPEISSSENLRANESVDFETPRRPSGQDVCGDENLVPPRAGCRRKLFADDCPEPALIQSERQDLIKYGVLVGKRKELLRQSVRSVKNMAFQPYLLQEMRKAGVELNFQNKMEDIEIILNYQNPLMEDIVEKLLDCLQQFVFLSELAAQGGTLVKLYPAEGFSKILWSDNVGLREWGEKPLAHQPPTEQPPTEQF